MLQDPPHAMENKCNPITELIRSTHHFSSKSYARHGRAHREYFTKTTTKIKTRNKNKKQNTTTQNITDYLAGRSEVSMELNIVRADQESKTKKRKKKKASDNDNDNDNDSQDDDIDDFDDLQLTQFNPIDNSLDAWDRAAPKKSKRRSCRLNHKGSHGSYAETDLSNKVKEIEDLDNLDYELKLKAFHVCLHKCHKKSCHIITYIYVGNDKQNSRRAPATG